MTTYYGTSGNDTWVVPRYGDPSGSLIDGLAGTDALSFDRLLRSRFTIQQDPLTGYILVDSVSGASSTYHLKLVHMEKLYFDFGSDVVDLTTMFPNLNSQAIKISSYAPALDSTGASVTPLIALTFNESVKAGSGSFQLLDANNHVVESFDINGSDVSLSAMSVTLHTNVILTYGMKYHLNIPAGIIVDGSGNAISASSGYGFTTVANTPPQASDADLQVKEGISYKGMLPTATDNDLGQSQVYYMAHAPTHGQLAVNTDGSFVYTPDTGYLGADAFTYSVYDGIDLSNAAQVSLTIVPAITTITGTTGDDTLTGTSGTDIITGDAGNDTIDGGDGLDTAVFSQDSAQYTLTIANGTITVADGSGHDGTDTLTAVERLDFSDKSLAFDLGGAAGTAARAIGAVYGPSALAQPDTVGNALHYLDQGNSALDLVAQLLDAAFGTNPSSTDIVQEVYANVVGTAPSAYALSHYAGLLDRGVFTPAQLVLIAADTTQNTTHIDLVGLAQTGLAYHFTG